MVGAGTMGCGIAQVAARAGLNVVMRDVSDEFLQRGIATISKSLQRDVDKGRLTARKVQILESKKPTTEMTIVRSISQSRLQRGHDNEVGYLSAGSKDHFTGGRMSSNLVRFQSQTCGSDFATDRLLAELYESGTFDELGGYSRGGEAMTRTQRRGRWPKRGEVRRGNDSPGLCRTGPDADDQRSDIGLYEGRKSGHREIISSA